MKKILVYILFSVASLNLFSGNLQPMVDSAQDLYMQSRYSEALTWYDSINNMGYSSSDLYYNMANCYFRMNDIPNSVYYYEKSLMLDPSNKDAEYNLAIANQMLKQNIEPVQKSFSDRVDTSIMTFMSTDAWAITSIILFVFLLAGIAMYLFLNSIVLRKIGFSVAVVALVFFVFTAIYAYKSSKLITENKYAIVFEQSMVKTSPNADAVNSFELYEGVKVMVSDSANGMYNIRLADGKEGWIDINNVKMLAK